MTKTIAMNRRRESAPSNDNGQRSGLGRASFIVGVINAVIFVLVLIAIVAINLLGSQRGEPPLAFLVFFVVVVAGIIVGLFPLLIGTALGIAALLRHEQRRRYAALGLLINGAVFGAWLPVFLYTLLLIGFGMSDAPL